MTFFHLTGTLWTYCLFTEPAYQSPGKEFTMNQVRLIIALVTLAFALPSHAGEFPTVQQAADAFLRGVPEDGYLITAEKLHERLKNGGKDFVVVDVRIPKEKTYDQGHIPGAISLGYPTIAKPENLAILPKDKDIILYCNTGHEENKVLAVLRMLGYQAYGLKWGYMAWKVLPPTGLTLKAIEGSILNNYPVEK
jgi:rhodanese-related sulfurtransferase